jgi:hypothetical protein
MPMKKRLNFEKMKKTVKICSLYHCPIDQHEVLLKGLSHEIFTIIFWLEWIYIGLKGNRFWFLIFKDVSLILDSNFKY